jgi:hypothetical protein
MANTTIVVSNAGWPAAAKKPAPEAAVKVSAPVASLPKLATPGAVAPPSLAVAKPERILLERIVDTAPGSAGTVFIQPAEPPSLASSSSKPATPSAPPKAQAEDFRE